MSMAVLIEGMEMPEKCSECPFHDGMFCKAFYGKTISYIGRDKKEYFCPLIEVHEPHGDLIDASEKIRVQMYDDEHEDFHTVEMTIDDLLSQSWVKAYAYPVIPASRGG